MGALSDEPPIRVRNGSMKITLDSGEWKADGDAWTPLRPATMRGGFTVTVDCAPGFGVRGAGRRRAARRSGSCTATRPRSRSGLQGRRRKTKVPPKDKLAKARPPGVAIRPGGRQGLHHRRRASRMARTRGAARSAAATPLSVDQHHVRCVERSAAPSSASPRPGGLAAEPPGTLRLRVTGADVSARGASARRRGRTPG